MRFPLALCSVLASTITGASAADLYTGTGAPESGYSEPSNSSGPNWAARFGFAFDAYYADSANVPEDWNYGANVDAAVMFQMGGGFGAQLDVYGSVFDNGDDDNDWTKNFITGAAHLFSRNPNGLLGIFGGGGSSDAEDTDESQTYWFLGLEGHKAGPWGTDLFAQAGYLDGNDEYGEGLNQAGFARLGGRMFTQTNTAFMAAISGASGQQDGEDAALATLELEVEQAFGNGSTSVFASYQGTFVWHHGYDSTSDFQGVLLGFRWRPGAHDLRSAYENGASLDLPQIGRWFSYTANEVEDD